MTQFQPLSELAATAATFIQPSSHRLDEHVLLLRGQLILINPLLFFFFFFFASAAVLQLKQHPLLDLSVGARLGVNGLDYFLLILQSHLLHLFCCLPHQLWRFRITWVGLGICHNWMPLQHVHTYTDTRINEQTLFFLVTSHQIY